jgi:toxin co-regulated pilus biosynthesis protein E
MFNSSLRVNFYEQLCALLSAGIPLYDAVKTLLEELNNQKNTFNSFWLLRKILADMIYRLDHGYSQISDILIGFVPENDLLILSVESDQTITALNKLIKMMAQFKKLKSEISKMFFIPIISVFLVFVLIFCANYYVFPSLIQLKPLSEFPSSTYDLYRICEFFVKNIVWIMLLIIFLTTSIFFSLATLTGSMRKILDFIPPYSIYKNISATNFLISLSMLLESGVDFDSAIAKLQEKSSKYLNSFLTKIDDCILNGYETGYALANINLFNKKTCIYISVLDKAGALSNGISNLVDRSIEIQIRSIKTLLMIISSLLMTLAFGFGLWLYMSVMVFGIHS